MKSFVAVILLSLGTLVMSHPNYTPEEVRANSSAKAFVYGTYEYNHGYLTSRWMPMYHIQKRFANPTGCGLLDKAIGLMPAFDEALASGDMITVRRFLRLYIKTLKDYTQYMTEPQFQSTVHAHMAMNENLINKVENDVSAMQELFKFWDKSYDITQFILTSLEKN